MAQAAAGEQPVERGGAGRKYFQVGGWRDPVLTYSSYPAKLPLQMANKVFARIVDDLGLKTLGEGNWHKFGGEGGVTGLLMLTESHLACHTYPE